jgi:uncharacterized membrane protein YkoI
MRAATAILLVTAFSASLGIAHADSVADATSVNVSTPDNDTETAVSVVQRGSSAPAQSDSHSSSVSGSTSQRVLSYGNILKQVKKSAPGDIVKVALLQKQRGVWTYEFEILDTAGKLTKVSVNAQTAAILSKTGR